MKTTIKALLMSSLIALLSSCNNPDLAIESIATQSADIVKPEKGINYSLDSTVVCCFCGMLDS